MFLIAPVLFGSIIVFLTQIIPDEYQLYIVLKLPELKEELTGKGVLLENSSHLRKMLLLGLYGQIQDVNVSVLGEDMLKVSTYCRGKQECENKENQLQDLSQKIEADLLAKVNELKDRIDNKKKLLLKKKKLIAEQIAKYQEWIKSNRGSVKLLIKKLKESQSPQELGVNYPFLMYKLQYLFSQEFSLEPDMFKLKEKLLALDETLSHYEKKKELIRSLYLYGPFILKEANQWKRKKLEVFVASVFFASMLEIGLWLFSYSL